MKRAVVLGFSRGKAHDTSHGDVVVHWEESVDAVRSLDLSDVDVIVVPFLHCVYEKSKEGKVDIQSMDRLGRALLLAAESGVACCLLLRTADAAVRGEIPASLGERVLEPDGIRMRGMAGGGSLVSAHSVAAGADAFSEYVDTCKVGTHQVFDFPDEYLPVPYLILAHGRGAKQDVWGFALRKGNGLVYVLPGLPTLEDRTDFMPVLVRSILRFQPLLRPERPLISESFQFATERELRTKRQRLAKEASEFDEKLIEYDRRKDILFLRDDDLADRIAEWLPRYLSLLATRIEEYREDLWIVNESGGARAICEVKALNQNVKREHITKLVMHREERNKPDDFPSILIANTFAGATTIPDKDKQRVGEREVAKAVRDHVLVVRTLDLLRLLDHVESRSLAQAEAHDLLLSSIGWLKVTDKGHQIVQA